MTAAESARAVFPEILELLGLPPRTVERHQRVAALQSILRYTDIADVIDLMGAKVRLYGDVPETLRSRAALCDSMAECLR